jgi:RNA polymerase sigma-70 factor (ECF subfamily)
MRRDLFDLIKGRWVMRSDEANGALAASSARPEAKPELILCSPGDPSSECSISEEEFVALTVRHERRVRLFIATLHPERGDVDEIVQDAWLVAWKKMEIFRYSGEQADEEFVRWLCTIARYEVMKYRRKSVPRLVLDEQVIDKLAALQFDEADYFEARHEALSVCIENLRPRDKLLIRRRYEENLSVHDLASCVGRSADAVYKSLNRIRTSLLACIERTLKREGYF